jgi:hypothetical protein
VAPGRPGASHLHDFVGNVSTDAFSTLTSLRSAGTECFRPEDTAAYWVPALYQGSARVIPQGTQIYYRAANKEPRTVQAFPSGFKVIAGDAHASARQDPTVASWNCGGGAPGIPSGGSVPFCPPGTLLTLKIQFPDCWNGANLDSADHKSHTAYAARSGPRRVCPATHPVALPQITLNVKYRTLGGPTTRLASGSADTAHADFFNAWNQPALEALVAGCITANIVCARGGPGSAKRAGA